MRYLVLEISALNLPSNFLIPASTGLDFRDFAHERISAGTDRDNLGNMGARDSLNNLLGSPHAVRGRCVTTLSHTKGLILNSIRRDDLSDM